jgi:hypothetical protein
VAVGAEGGDLGVRGGGRGAEGDGRGDLGDGVVHPLSLYLLFSLLYIMLCSCDDTFSTGFFIFLGLFLGLFLGFFLFFSLPSCCLGFLLFSTFPYSSPSSVMSPSLLLRFRVCWEEKKEWDSGRKRWLYHTTGEEEQQQRRCRNSDEAKKEPKISEIDREIMMTAAI